MNRSSRITLNRVAGLALTLVVVAPLLVGCPFGPLCLSLHPTTSIALQLVADGFVAPVGMAVPRDGSGRKFILDQVGRIYIIDADGQRLATPFLDLSDRMPTIGIDFGNGIVFDERGLLGLAFHPDYVDNGRFFVFYTVPKGDDDPEDFDSQNLVSEFHVSQNDPNQADPASERILLEIDKPQFNHNGGQIVFGPDGYLYISVGDGGAANDDGVGHNPDTGNGQDKSTFLGKILRIDVNSGDPYAIPADNPFVGDAMALPEIYALGFRNPWRFSFDSQGRLIVADVGQDLYEEVDIVMRGGNYGWRIREGFHCFDKDAPMDPPDNCPTTDADGNPLIDPILEYPHTAAVQPFGIAATGGFIYRGASAPCLHGEYIFGDWSTNFLAPDGSIYAAREAPDGTWSMRELAIAGQPDGRIERFVLSFGEDESGELYVLTSQRLGPTDMTGAVHRIVAAP